MDNQKYKKDSVFSSVFPEQTPASPPAPAAAPAHKPEVSEGQVSALNKKIEMLERNIVGELQRTLAEHASAPPPPPPPPSPAIPAVISKITEMENRFKEFQEKFLIGAAQMKNIEESKISARREIEELLKVVREQQKYSELDRQMHDQLEKAWGRVEELEKRMMEVYAAAVTRPPEVAVPVVAPEKIAAEVMKAVEVGLAARFKALEDKLQEVARKDVVPGPRAIDSVAIAVTAALDGRFQRLTEAVAKVSSERTNWIEALHYAEGTLGKEALGAIREGFKEAGGTFLNHIDGASQQGKENIDSLARMLVGHIDELAAASRENSFKIEMLGTALRAEKEKELLALSAVMMLIVPPTAPSP